MREPPPADLAELLAALGLVDRSQWQRLAGEVRRLAGDLPRFESIWLDVLVRRGALTRWQAQEIAAGRGPRLSVGPWVIEEPAAGCLFASTYRARHREQAETVRLMLVPRDPPRTDAPRTDELEQRLAELAEQAKRLTEVHVEGASVAPITASGADGDRLWAAGPWHDGRTMAQWMVRTGRFPPDVELHIARTMTAALAELESRGVVHGDLTLSSLLIGPEAEVVLLHPGLRGVLRASEGYAHAELPPEAYDTLAPQRVADGTAPDGASDRYACGLVWHHLLAGRPPLVGGSASAKLRAAHEARIAPLDELAIDVPPPLATLIGDCVDREPARRPESFAAMATRLGPPEAAGQERLHALLASCGRVPLRTVHRAVRTTSPARRRLAVAVGAAVMVAAAVGLWMVFAVPRRGAQGVGAQGVGERVDVAVEDGRPSAPSHESPDNRRSTPSRRFPDRRSGEPRSEDQSPATLPTDRPIELASLSLRAGQVIRPEGDGRATVHVPRTGLQLEIALGEQGMTRPARLERIDFVWPHAPVADSAMLIVHGQSLVLDGCTFRVEGVEAASHRVVPVAVRWEDRPTAVADDRLALPSGWLRLSRCRLAGVSAAVDCRPRGAIRIECDNVLHIGPGPLLSTPDAPAADEPMVVDLRRVTVRGAQALWRCRQADRHAQPGSVWIRADQSIFMPASGGGLLVFESTDRPTALLGELRWTGEGSLVGQEVPIAAWRADDGRLEPMDDSRVSIAGLVRSRVEFAAAIDPCPAANRAVDYQAPIRASAPGEQTSTDPPGAAIDELP